MSPERTVTTPDFSSDDGAVHRLLLLHSPVPGEVGRSLLLRTEPVVLGRSTEEGRWPVQDGEVSRAHARVQIKSDGSCRIEDMGSRNGLFVNGARAHDVTLAPGSIVRLGSTLLQYQRLAETDTRFLLESGAELGLMVGTGHAHRKLQHQLRLAAPGTLPVLILGATGVGKELVAKAIHEGSGRAGAFVPVNCAALPETLVESELFGHTGGAFTGAQRREGLFTYAQDGTLFLDEVGELKQPMQATLLRVLATGEVRPVGSDQARRVNARVVAATNQDLKTAVAEGRFRADLYARLAGHLLDLPSLRERKEDVLPLLVHFLRDRKLHVTITGDAAEALLVYDWPFNVRELEQLAGRLESTLRATRRLSLDDLPGELRAALEPRRSGAKRASAGGSLSVLSVRRDVPPNREELLLVLEHYSGNISDVASFFGKGRRQVYRWIDRHQIDLTVTRS